MAPAVRILHTLTSVDNELRQSCVEMSQAMEEMNDLVGAAELVWCASSLGGLGRVSGETRTDLSYRTADLLANLPEKWDDDAVVRAFEMEVAQSCVMRDQGSDQEPRVSRKLPAFSLLSSRGS